MLLDGMGWDGMGWDGGSEQLGAEWTDSLTQRKLTRDAVKSTRQCAKRQAGREVLVIGAQFDRKRGGGAQGGRCCV